MHAALWLLLELSIKSWFRRLGRMLQTPKGILFALGLALFFGPYLVMAAIAGMAMQTQGRHFVDPELVRRFGTLSILCYSLLAVLFASPERALHFTPAQVEFLFPGPFTRREILLFRLLSILLPLPLIAGFLSLAFRAYASGFLAVFLGTGLTLMFFQLLGTAAGFLAGTVGALAYSRGRKLILVLLAAGVTLAFVPVGPVTPPASFRAAADALAESPVLSVLLAPLRWFAEILTAERLWPDLVLYGFLGLGVNVVLLGLVLVLDYQYLEAAALGSERLYERLQRIRKGGIAANWSPSGKVRGSLPSLPWWGGMGPVGWRQLLAARRSLKGMSVVLVVFTAIMLVRILEQRNNPQQVSDPGMQLGLVILIFSVFLLPHWLTFDFRGDVDRMDVLKSLPVGAVPLVLGQLLAPVLLASTVQWLLMLAVQGVFGGVGMVLLSVFVFAMPVNLLLFEIENIIFLLYPTRLTPGTAGDVQTIGRQIIFVWVRLLVLGLIALVIGLAALLAAVLTGWSWIAPVFTAWVLLLAVDAALVPLLALAFRKFDVARDTPA